MYIIVGLGNPTRQYEGTKHNVGFDTIDYLIDEYQIPSSGTGHKALFGKGMIAGQKVIVAKPMTYMNLSGESVRELVNYYKVDPESELIVVYDDISLAPGQIRIRKKGSAGGHNGIKNIIANLGTDHFMRVKVGVGEKPKKLGSGGLRVKSVYERRTSPCKSGDRACGKSNRADAERGCGRSHERV